MKYRIKHHKNIRPGLDSYIIQLVDGIWDKKEDLVRFCDEEGICGWVIKDFGNIKIMEVETEI